MTTDKRQLFISAVDEIERREWMEDISSLRDPTLPKILSMSDTPLPTQNTETKSTEAKKIENAFSDWAGGTTRSVSVSGNYVMRDSQDSGDKLKPGFVLFKNRSPRKDRSGGSMDMIISPRKERSLIGEERWKEGPGEGEKSEKGGEGEEKEGKIDKEEKEKTEGEEDLKSHEEEKSDGSSSDGPSEEKKTSEERPRRPTRPPRKTKEKQPQKSGEGNEGESGGNLQVAFDAGSYQQETTDQVPLGGEEEEGQFYEGEFVEGEFYENEFYDEGGFYEDGFYEGQVVDGAVEGVSGEVDRGFDERSVVGAPKTSCSSEVSELATTTGLPTSIGDGQGDLSIEGR